MAELLLCQNCGSDYLHHWSIDVWNRTTEDATDGMHISVAKQRIAIDTEMEGNPSPRRDGVAIRFYCENCDVLSVLHIGQHKGQTFFEMRKVEP